MLLRVRPLDTDVAISQGTSIAISSLPRRRPFVRPLTLPSPGNGGSKASLIGRSIDPMNATDDNSRTFDPSDVRKFQTISKKVSPRGALEPGGRGDAAGSETGAGESGGDGGDGGNGGNGGNVRPSLDLYPWTLPVLTREIT